MFRKNPILDIPDLRAGQLIEINNTTYTIESIRISKDSIFISVAETSEQFLFDQNRVKVNYRKI